METTFGLKNMQIAQKMVEDFVRTGLYPPVTRLGLPDLEFEVRILASTGLTTQEDFRIYLTTTLDDGVLFEVVQLIDQAEPQLKVYKDILEDGIDE